MQQSTMYQMLLTVIAEFWRFILGATAGEEQQHRLISCSGNMTTNS
jgi:hypothetical protein